MAVGAAAFGAAGSELVGAQDDDGHPVGQCSGERGLARARQATDENESHAAALQMVNREAEQRARQSAACDSPCSWRIEVTLALMAAR